METLPPELLEPIFLQACTDGGQTGCALSLTSKSIRVASRTARFHTVALVSGSPSQVVQFVACFSSERELAGDVEPPVRHLCLAAAQRARPRPAFRPQARAADSEGESFPSAVEQSQPAAMGKQETQKETQRYVRDVMALVHMLAPDLETLCLIDPDPRREMEALHFPTLLSAGFPSLLELAIVGNEPVIRPTAEARTPLYPRLKTLHRIHVARVLRLHTIEDAQNATLEGWKERAPLLTEMNVSQLGGLRYGAGIAELLHKLLLDRKIQLSPIIEELLSFKRMGRRRALSNPDV
ncbi:hypothetical protein OH77DRAFT_1504237 [Trametes cingulata]|nr:hypothetical protein OH77DRAFT_1504237 [Trametes cingulata]